MAITSSGGKTTVTLGKETGTATSGASTTITDTSKSWTTNAYAGRFVYIHTGTGIGQIRYINSNTSTALTVDFAWTTNPDSTSQYTISYNLDDLASGSATCTKYGNSTYIITEDLQIGDGTNWAFFADTQKQFIMQNEFLPQPKSVTRFGRFDSYGDTFGGCDIRCDTTEFTLGFTYYETVLKTAVMLLEFLSCKLKVGGRIVLGQSPDANIKIIDSICNVPGMALYGDESVLKNLIITGQTGASAAYALGPRAPMTLDNITVQNSDYGVFFATDFITYAKGLKLRNITTTEFVIKYVRTGFTTGIIDFDLVDIEATDWSFSWEQAEDARVYRKYTVSTTVKDSTDTVLENARVYVEDSTGTEVANELTAATGKITDLELANGVYKQVGITSTTPSTPSTETDFTSNTPHIVKLRQYGKIFFETIKEVSSPASDGYKVLTNNYVSAAYATAWAYTGFTITGDTSIAMSSAHTLQQLYDYSQAWSVQSGNIQYIEPITTTNGTLFTGNASYDLTLSQVLTATGKTYSTAADVTLSGSGAFDCTMEINGGTLTTPTFANVDGNVNLIGGTWVLSDAGTAVGGSADATSTITVDTASADDEFDFQNFTFDASTDFENTSGNDIILILGVGQQAPTLVETSGSITIEQPTVDTGLSFSGLVAGSQVIVFETGTQTVIDSVETSGTTFEWSETYSADQTVDYTIINEGYTPIRVTGVTVSTSVQSVTVQQSTDRAYVASSGLTFGTNASYNTSTEIFTLSTATTLQNYYSFMIESWRDESTLKNVKFPFVPNGNNSFTLIDGVEFDEDDIPFLSRDGLRYTDGGTCTACYSAILTSGVPSGLQVTYQQQDGTGTTDAATTGNMDELIQVMGDATHGNFDYTGHLVLKVQADGYDQAEADVVDTYGTLADELYVVGLTPTPNGIDTGNPSLANPPTITDHGASPVTWNSKDYSITITDSAAGNSGAEIMQWLRYNFSQGGTFQSKDAFNWHDLVRENGEKFKTVRGAIYGDASADLKGVRVLRNDGSTLHTDFNQFTADDGTTWDAPVYQTCRVSGCTAGTRIQIYDTESDTELYNGEPTFPYTYTHATAYSADITFRIRTMYVDGTDAKIFTQNTAGTATEASPDVSITIEHTNDTVYSTNAIDGSTVTGVTIDDTNLLVNVSTGSMTWQDIYAYETYWLGTEEGIRDEGRFIVAKDTANYIFYSFDIKNVSSPSVPLVISGAYAVDSGTGASIDIVDTSGGTIILAPDHVVEKLTTVTGSNVITGDIADLNDIAVADVVTGMQAVAGDFKADVSGLATEANATTNHDDIIDAMEGAVTVITSEIPTAADNADAVWDEAEADHTTQGTTGKRLSDTKKIV